MLNHPIAIRSIHKSSVRRKGNFETKKNILGTMTQSYLQMARYIGQNMMMTFGLMSYILIKYYNYMIWK